MASGGINSPLNPGCGGLAPTDALANAIGYTSPIVVRTQRNILYIHWDKPLFGLNHWLLVCDIAGHREIVKRRVYIEFGEAFGVRRQSDTAGEFGFRSA